MVVSLRSDQSEATYTIMRQCLYYNQRLCINDFAISTIHRLRGSVEGSIIVYGESVL